MQTHEGTRVKIIYTINKSIDPTLSNACVTLQIYQGQGVMPSTFANAVEQNGILFYVYLHSLPPYLLKES